MSSRRAAALLGLTACSWTPPDVAPDQPAVAPAPIAPSDPSQVADIYGSPATMGEPAAMGGPEVPVGARALPPVPDYGVFPEDCTLDREGLTATLAATQEGVPVKLTRPGWVVEEFTLPDGMPVRWSQGGCSHYGMIAEFGLLAPPADARAEALRLLGRLAPAEGELPMLAQLKAAPALGENGSFPCGEAHCDVRVETEGGLRLLVSYDFPL